MRISGSGTLHVRQGFGLFAGRRVQKKGIVVTVRGEIVLVATDVNDFGCGLDF